MQLHFCNYIDAAKNNVFDGINKHMRVWESHIFSHVTIKSSLTHPIFCCSALFHFFLNEWVGSDELRSKKCDQQQTNNNITSSLIIRWPSCNTMLQYSRNAINVYMFFIIIAISFYWYGNALHCIEFDLKIVSLPFLWDKFKPATDSKNLIIEYKQGGSVHGRRS